MLLELGVKAVILGHSERRQHFGETDEALARKVPAALEAGLLPILCVGENEAQRDADETADVLTRQIDADLAEVPEDAARARSSIAYEPIWAIGTGQDRHARAGPGGVRPDPGPPARAAAPTWPSGSASSTAARSSPATPPS